MRLAVAAVVSAVVSSTHPVDSSGTPAASVTLSLAIYSSDLDRVSLGLSTGHLQVTEVWISLKDFRLRDASGCETAKPAGEFRGPLTAELVGRPASVGPLAVGEGHYCGLDVTYRRSAGKSQSAPLEMRGRSLLIRGRRDDGVRFVVRTTFDQTLRLRTAQLEGFELAPGASRIFLAIDAAEWLPALDLSKAQVERGPTGLIIRIDEKANPELLRAVEKRLASGVHVYRDEDGDGLLSSAERARGSELASGRASPAR